MPDIFTQHSDKLPRFSRGNKTKPVGLFTSFCQNPRDVCLFNKIPDEAVLLFLRANRAATIPHAFFAVLLSCIPPVFAVFTSERGIPLYGMPDSFFLSVMLFYYVLIFGFILVNQISWFYSICLITNKRIYKIGFSDISRVDTQEADLSDLKHSTYTRAGFLQLLFDYGDIAIHQAGRKQTLTLHNMPKPEEINKIINKILKEKDL